MRINDFHNILELVKQDILQSEAEYLKLLKVVGNNQRYDFRSQLSIYDKNPEATACAKFDYWRERFNRTVMRGQKGIPILEDYGTYKKVDYIFDISQTVSKNRDVNEVNLWRFDKEAHKDVLKEMIKTEGYEESESTLENIFSLSRLYGDEKIDNLMNELRIADEDRISFTKFVRDSISYAVASRFKLDYPMDKELLKENFAMLDSISLMSLGETVSDISGTVIDTTIQKSKELELKKEVLRGKEAGYNKIKEELEEVEENVLRRDDQERISENERIFRNGKYGRDNRENQGEYTESVRGRDGLYEEYPNPVYAVMRLNYLSNSEEQSHFEMLVDLYKEKKLTKHLMDTQKQVIEFMRAEKQKLMMSWQIENESHPQYKAMISALKEMTIKEVVEI
uniref:Helicase n=1 Tax=Clostridioides difficile TaxID=1496 RepID=A0A381IB19_CLODI|nr:helicase [Clostridioides difficile]